MEYTGKIRIFKVEDREAVAGILSGERKGSHGQPEPDCLPR